MANNNTNKKLAKKHIGLSVLPIVGAAILAGGALAGAGVSVWHISKNYEASAEFSNSFSARVKVIPDGVDEASRKESLKQTAERLSSWLRYSGQSSYDVSYEYYDTKDPSNPCECYLNAKFSVEKIKSKLASHEDKKVDNDPYLSIFSSGGFNSNNKTIVYRWWNREESSTPVYSIYKMSDLINIPTKTDEKDAKTKAMTDKAGKQGVMYEIKKAETGKANLVDFFNDLHEAKKHNDEEEKKEKDKHPIKIEHQPRMYIINNYEGFINEATYHVAHYIKEGDPKYQSVYNDSEYKSFADKYIHSKSPNKYYFEATGNDHDTKQPIPNSDLLGLIDAKTAGTIDYKWMNSYVDRIIKFQSDDYTNFFPKIITDTYKNEGIKDDGSADSLSYMWLTFPTMNDAKKYLDSDIKYGFKGHFVNIDFSKDAPEGLQVFEQLTTKYYAKRDVAPIFQKSIFGKDNIIPWMCLGFLIFLVVLGILLAALYRMTGVISWICMMFALSMTALIATISSWTISMSLLFGLFIMGIVMFMAASIICGRMKRRLQSGEDTNVIVNKTFKKSLWPLIDISVIVLAFGVCFTYIAPMSLNSLGLILIIGAFATFIGMFLFNGLLHQLFFKNRIAFNKFGVFGSPSNKANEALMQGQMNIPNSLDATRLEFGCYSVMSKTKLSAVNIRSIIALSVLGAVLIVGMVLFGVFGWAANGLFNSSVCIAIYSESDLIHNPAFINLHLNYSSFTHIDNELWKDPWWYFYLDKMPSAATIDAMVKSFGNLNDHVLLQDVTGSTNRDTLVFALISIVSGASIAAVYSGIRCNWTTFVPMILGTFCIPLLTLGISAMAQIKFDQIVVLGFVLVVVVNSILSTNIVWAVNESWDRKYGYTKEEYKYIVNAALKNSWTHIWLSAAAMGLFLIAFGVTAPFGINSTIYLMLIGFLASVIVTPFSICLILYYFLNIRTRAVSKYYLKKSNKVRVNLDEIDEQELEGINKHTKHRVVIVRSKENGNEQKVTIN